MVIIRPVEQVREVKFGIFGINVAISWPAKTREERREHVEEAIYLALFLANHEKREYGIYSEYDIENPITIIKPIALEEVWEHVDYYAEAND